MMSKEVHFIVKRKGVRDDKKNIEVSEDAFAIVQAIDRLTEAMNAQTRRF